MLWLVYWTLVALYGLGQGRAAYSDWGKSRDHLLRAGGAEIESYADLQKKIRYLSEQQ